jgi:hypothetical protein
VITENGGEVEVEIDPLARFRGLEPEPKVVMSDKVAERLKQINYEDRIRKQDEEKFAYALSQIAPTAENVEKLIVRCVGHSRLLDRRTHKLLFWIQGRGYRLGHEIRLPEDISFLSELTSDEAAMSDAAFFATWKVKKIVAPISDEPEGRPCKSGQKCMWLKHRKPATAVGRSLYCTPNCQKSDTARRLRAKQACGGPEPSQIPA